MEFWVFHKVPALAPCCAICLRKGVISLKFNKLSPNYNDVKHLELSYSFKFAILVSGFPSRLSPHAAYFSTKKVIPTLHVIGDTDRIVEKGKVSNNFHKSCPLISSDYLQK